MGDLKTTVNNGIVSAENRLIDEIGADDLKKIGEEIAEIVRQHNLQHSQQICRELFSYLSDVIDGWNCV